MTKTLYSAFLALLLAPVFAWGASPEPLDPNVAYAFSARALDADTVRAEWQIVDGYYLYRQKTRFESRTPGITLGEPVFPAGLPHEDEFFGRSEVYRGRLTIDIPVKREAGAGATLELVAHSQGCADLGLCYPPQEQKAQITLTTAGDAAGGGGALDALKRFGARLGLSGGNQPFLDPEQAFVFTASAPDGQTLVAHWDIADKYYLYRDKFEFRLKGTEEIRLGPPGKPGGVMKDDEAFGRTEVYYGPIDIRLPVVRPAGESAPITLEAVYQGCADAGLCYPPITKTLDLVLPAATAASTANTPSEPLSEQDELARSLATDTLWLNVVTFFGLGLLLAFTPCVFPMIPILSSIIVGHGHTITTRKAFMLSLVYVVAMALTYTVAGVIAGLFGQNLQAVFQNPWVLGSFSVLFVLLALSMFGFYELQLPAGLQTRLTELSGRQERGSLLGTATMGFLSALIVGPCVAPPLAGALIYIGQSGDAVLGGLALFALSLGMGAPLLALGASAGRLLPKAGGWMERVKNVFGVVMLGLAIWMLERIIPPTLTLALWAMLFVVSGIYLGALEPLGREASGWQRLWKGLGIVALLYGAVLLIGAASGGRDVLQPLQALTATTGTTASAAQPAALSFKTVKTTEALDRELAAARDQGRPVMLDFYADWCISCKEMEHSTFADAGVQQALANFTLLQVDVTKNEAADKALLKHFELFGPPGIIFWNAQGEERRNLRVVGFMGAEPFKAHLTKVQ